MKKECCNIKISETEKGFCLEVEGDEVKDKCKTVFSNCCSGEMIKKFQSCCKPE